MGARCASSSMKGRICRAPRAPVHANREQRHVRDGNQKASTGCCPERVRPAPFTMVTETMTETRRPAVEIFFQAEQGGLGVQRVEGGFGQQQVHRLDEEARALGAVGLAQLGRR